MSQSNSTKPSFVVAAVVGLAVLVAAGPTLVAVIEAAVPLVIAGGVIYIAAKLALFHTRQ